MQRQCKSTRSGKIYNSGGRGKKETMNAMKILIVPWSEKSTGTETLTGAISSGKRKIA